MEKALQTEDKVTKYYQILVFIVRLVRKIGKIFRDQKDTGEDTKK